MLPWAALLGALFACGCRSAKGHRAEADRAASRIIESAQQQALGRTEPVEVESAAETLRRRLLLDQQIPRRGPASLGVHDLPASPQWDGRKHLGEGGGPVVPAVGPAGLTIGLLEALQIGARSSREYQQAKETLFRSALDLDLERDAFRNTFSGMLAGEIDRDSTGDVSVDSARGAAEAGVKRKFRNGIEVSSRIAVDLVRLLTQDVSSSLGLLADASISIPLLRGAGRDIAAEPLRQAEQNMLYSVYEFERFKSGFAVRVASEYLAVLQDRQQVGNVEENYKRLIASTRWARRLADAGRLPEFQLDQAVQDEFRARTRWVVAKQSYASRLDGFRNLLGLPPDAGVELDAGELERLHAVAERFAQPAGTGSSAGPVPPADAPITLREPDRAEAGPLEMEADRAIRLALDARLDLRVAEGKVQDAQRRVYVAADALRGEVTLLGKAQAGESRASAASAGEENARIRPDNGAYSGLINLDLPLERTAEQAAYRKSLMDLEEAVRAFQETEDKIKLEIRKDLGDLLAARESVQIQLQAVELAEKRVRSTDLFLQAGRAQIRDVLESQEALLNVQNALLASVVSHRNAELALQRDLELLRVSEDGLWEEYAPGEQSE